MPSISVPNLKFLASWVPEVLGVTKFWMGSRVPIWPFWAFLKFLISTVSEILGVQQFQKCVTWRPHIPFEKFCFFSLVLTAVHLCAKFEVSNFNRSRDINRSQNTKSGSRDPPITLSTQFCIFFLFSFLLTATHFCAKFEVSNFNSSPDIRRTQNSKSGWRDPYMTLMI